MTTEELITSAAPLIGDIGAAFYFTPDTTARGAELGLNIIQWYVVGRGGVLGNVEPAVVQAAFGYFAPSMVATAWRGATEIIEPRQAGRAHFLCAAEFGRARFAGVAGLDGFVTAAHRVVKAAEPDGLPLFAGYAAEPMVDDLPGRAMQLVVVLRELRGSAHLAAVRAAGLSAKTAHFIKRPDAARLFGWDAERDVPTIDDAHRAALDDAERMTSGMVRPAFEVLDDDGRDQLLAGLRVLGSAAGIG